MKRIRLGNTVDIVWEIFLGKDKDKGKYDLTGKKLTIYLVSAFEIIKISDFTTEFNVLRFTFEGKDQKHAGRYQLTFVENEGSDDTRTLNLCDAFELVRESCKETDDLSEITLASSFDALRIYPIIPQVGPNRNWWVDGVDTGKSSVGLTAYEFAKEQGYEGTEEEYAAECLAVPVLNEESRTATAEAREATEESIAQHESVSNYMNDVAEPTVAAAAQIAKDVQAAIDEIDPVLNGKADKVQFEGKSYVETDGISTDDFYYSMPDSADGTEDDIIATKSNLKKINGQDLYGKGNIVIEGKNYDNEIATLQQKDAQTEAKLAQLSAEIDTYFPLKGNLYTGETINGYVNSTTGAFNEYSSARSSLPIPIVGGKVYSLTGRNGDASSLRCLDAEGNPLKVLAAKTRKEAISFQMPNLDGTGVDMNGQFATPINAVSFQFCIQVSQASSNDIVLEYVGDEYSADFVPSHFNGYGNADKRLGVKYIPSELTQEIHDIQEKVAEIEDAVVVSETLDLQGQNNYAYTMAVGSAPVGAARSEYIAFVAEGLNKGDVIIPKTQTGSSLNSYAKVKKGIIIEVGAKSEALNSPIECDGSFDALYINNYTGYVFTPSCQLVTRASVLDIAERAEKASKKSIKVLCLGNSFTQDSMSYVPFILKNIAPDLDVTIGIAYIGGCPLAQHCANLTGENQVLNGITYSPTTYIYQLYENGNTAWKSVGSKTIDEMLSEKEWDIITLQQNGSDAANSWDVCYAPFIYKIHRLLAEKCSNAIKLGWLLVHGSYSNTTEVLQSNWQGSAENTQKIQDLTPNQLVFPYGTAVQNLRTTPLANLGDGGNLMGDTAHLHEGIGCLAAAYANTLTILDALGLGKVSVIGEGTRPTKAWCTEHGVLSPNYGATTNDVVGITEDNCFLAQVAAIQAVKKPYEISDLANFVV